METVVTAVTLLGTGCGLLMWLVQTLRHRGHLAQCIQDLRRQRRLDRRLTGCVNDMERILDQMPPQTTADQVPEALAAHAHFLYGLRREALDNVIHLSGHAVRLRWPDGYLSKVTLAGRRCEVAHGALVTAFRALADATREYERGLASALRSSGDGERARSASQPVRLLDESSAAEVARLREVCELACTLAADACKLRFQSTAMFDATWPVRRSEIMPAGTDPYCGETRPLGWGGFGPQPLLHVDAR